MLVAGLVRFFFDPPVDGSRSRGNFFGFRKDLRPEGRDIWLFLEKQAKGNLGNYCDLIKQRFVLVLKCLSKRPGNRYVYRQTFVVRDSRHPGIEWMITHRVA
jgi:hypothetical protein